MALNSRGAIDPRWLTHNQAVGYGLQLATVEIYSPALGDQVYDPATNTFSGTKETLYTGPARIQPTSGPVESSEEYNPTNLQTVRVVIPVNKNTLDGSSGILPDIRPNHKLLVTSSPYNAQLESFSYEVIGVLNSSNAWERTLVCRVDMELDINNV
jgi:hypothetical protein